MTEYTITLTTRAYEYIDDNIKAIEGEQRFTCYHLAEVQNLLSCMIASADGILHLTISQREMEAEE